MMHADVVGVLVLEGLDGRPADERRRRQLIAPRGHHLVGDFGLLRGEVEERYRDAAHADRPTPCAGTPAHVAERVAAWQAVGVDEVIVPDFALGSGSAKLDALDAIVEQVAPDFR
jgi:alkanesulfonate monooxygenase SsuD/methylene tetrahydromethanopterin reductase-like flavin-dependent oxidoreductase (luciferase family)